MKRTSTASLIILASVLPLGVKATQVREPIFEDIHDQVFQSYPNEPNHILEGRATALYRIAVRETRRARADLKRQESLKHFSERGLLKFKGKAFIKKIYSNELAAPQGDCFVHIQPRKNSLNVESSAYGRIFNSKDLMILQDIDAKDTSYKWGSGFYSLELDTETHKPIAARTYYINLQSDSPPSTITSCEDLESE